MMEEETAQAQTQTLTLTLTRWMQYLPPQGMPTRMPAPDGRLLRGIRPCCRGWGSGKTIGVTWSCTGDAADRRKPTSSNGISTMTPHPFQASIFRPDGPPLTRVTTTHAPSLFINLAESATVGMASGSTRSPVQYTQYKYSTVPGYSTVYRARVLYWVLHSRRPSIKHEHGN